MTLTIIDECTHNKTFSVYDKPNGALKKLEEAGYHLNPRVHDQSDGPHADPSSAGTLLPRRESGNAGSESKGPSDIFEEDD